MNKLLWPWSLRADSPRAKEVDLCQVVASDQSLFEEDMLGTKIEAFHVPADGDVQSCVDMTGIVAQLMIVVLFMINKYDAV